MMSKMEQSLLLKQGPETENKGPNLTYVSDQFADKGFHFQTKVENIQQAGAIMKYLIDHLNPAKVNHLKPFLPELNQADIDQIPSCLFPDTINTDNISFHFERGLPLVAKETFESVYPFLGLYLPKDAPQTNTLTRLLDFKGIAKNLTQLPLSELKLKEYVNCFGDGDKLLSTGRLNCSARVLDAFLDLPQLIHMADHQKAQWFNFSPDKTLRDGIYEEVKFYKQFNLDIDQLAHYFKLSPGDLLIIDNYRMAHARVGKRNPRELTQILFSNSCMTSVQIDQFRKSFFELITL